MATSLPMGWTIEEVRIVSGDASAAVSPTKPPVLSLESTAGQPTYEPVSPDLVGTILQFHDLYLVSIEGEWNMGTRNPDGAIACWASYGTNFREALRGL
ncbi:hypothetical protein [Actinomadura kijaniata]|uniref:hypothetical protein n=1 Tax=Actinomadura kijaniata TaxID=46161 RepID=UPI000A031AAC|nr:hypothetical protein [Actinomadura kijaniata]